MTHLSKRFLPLSTRRTVALSTKGYYLIRTNAFLSLPQGWNSFSWLFIQGNKRLTAICANERERQFNTCRNAARRDLHGRRMRTQSRPGRLWRGVDSSQEAQGSQWRVSEDHQQSDGNLRRHCGPRDVEAALQSNALQ